MFPLPTNEFPPTAEALRDAIRESLLEVIRPDNLEVAVTDGSYPHLAALRISLDNTVARKPISGLRPPTPTGKVNDALEVDEFELRGQPFLVEGARFYLNCQARGVRIGRSKDKNGKPLLVLQEAGDGEVEIAAGLADLETLLMAIVQSELSRSAVRIEELRIDLRPRGPRGIDIAVHARGRKLFLSASLRVSGSMEIDDQFEGRLFNLTCTGDGPIGVIACGAISPRLEAWNGVRFPLMALPIGTAKLRDVQIDAKDGLRVSARFGNEKA